MAPNFASWVPAPRGKAISRASGVPARTLAAIAAIGADAPAFEFGRRQHSRPRIEDLHRFRAGGDLAEEICGRGVDEPVDQPREQVRLAIGEQPRRRLVRRSAAGDHVARHRPWRAAEADQRRLLRQRALQALERLEHRREPAPVRLLAELREALSVADRVETGPSPVSKVTRLAKRVRQ